MSNKVDHAEHDGWPSNQWHPVYSGIREWLENEAPVASPLVIDALTKKRNKPRFRLVRRKT